MSLIKIQFQAEGTLVRFCLLVITFLTLASGSESIAAKLRVSVIDADTGQLQACRVYLSNAQGDWFFAKSDAPGASITYYNKVNWIRSDAFEKHSSISSSPFHFELSPGEYQLRVERGKEYLPEHQKILISPNQNDLELEIQLQRWINMADRDWYSGETHIHRELKDLPNIILAEDLNVALPLTYWVTQGGLAPSRGNKNQEETGQTQLIQADPTHVIWPMNTEYEIFQVRGQAHTLGALFVLNHKKSLQLAAPPWRAIANEARRQGALLDMDKLDWPFAMTLPHISGATLYELANNHMWRTEFAFKDWNTTAPGYMLPKGEHQKQGGEADWIHYTLGMYYTLLNAGFDLVPSAGTAGGVHPVPVGFSRVYVEMPGGFNYEEWMHGLAQGRSFVTTGPMLLAKINGHSLGMAPQEFEKAQSVTIAGEILSEKPVNSIEAVNEKWEIQKIKLDPKPTSTGTWRAEFSFNSAVTETGWIALRCFENRQAGRIRFAHTAPWKFKLKNQPLRISVIEKEYLTTRVEEEMKRSRELMDIVSWKEYEDALKYYQSLPTR